MLYHVPTPKVKLQAEMGLPSNPLPDIRHTPWPISPPNEQQPRIHFSMREGTATQPTFSSENNIVDNFDQHGSTLFDLQNFNMNIANPAVTPPSTLDNDTLYNCNIIAQLWGNYEMDTSAGPMQIQVILPEVPEQEDQYAIAHRVNNDGKVLDDLCIYEEPSCFTLTSASGKVQGILRKGCNMKHSITWQNYDDDTYIVWRRKGKVKFNIVQVEPKRRNSICSVRTVSTSPILTQSIDTPMVGGDDNPVPILPELLHQRAPVFVHLQPKGQHSSTNDSFHSQSSNFGLGIPSVMSVQQQEEIFQLIKRHCANSPLLFKKIVDWGTKNNPYVDISDEERKSLSEGKLWIVAHTVDVGEGEIITDSLDDIKGAYLKVDDSVWQQPDPGACGSEVQHRLYKDQQGRWMLERRCIDSLEWQMRAQELEDGQWIDFQNNKIKILVYVVPMTSILDRMGEEILERKHDLKKSIDFLFTCCNQVKLSKLKGRNLKHHIANLRVKLEKRYALNFGIQVANTAEAISRE